MKKRKRPINWWCRFFGHIPKCTEKYRYDCPNVCLYICRRCGRASMIYPPTLYYALKDRWRDLEDYKNEKYVEDLDMDKDQTHEDSKANCGEHQSAQGS